MDEAILCLFFLIIFGKNLNQALVHDTMQHHTHSHLHIALGLCPELAPMRRCCASCKDKMPPVLEIWIKVATPTRSNNSSRHAATRDS